MVRTMSGLINCNIKVSPDYFCHRNSLMMMTRRSTIISTTFILFENNLHFNNYYNTNIILHRILSTTLLLLEQVSPSQNVYKTNITLFEWFPLIFNVNYNSFCVGTQWLSHSFVNAQPYSRNHCATDSENFNYMTP